MKKMLTVVMILGIVFISGCGKWDRFTSSVTGQPAKTCVDGVTYLQFTSGATVQVNTEGKPVLCK